MRLKNVCVTSLKYVINPIKERNENAGSQDMVCLNFDSALSWLFLNYILNKT